MPRFFNNDVFNMPTENMVEKPQECCQMPQPMPPCGCKKPDCPTIYKECPPIVTCSKQTLNQYHITKQPYIHNYVTEVVHHHVLQNEFIPKYSCYEVHVNDTTQNN